MIPYTYCETCVHFNKYDFKSYFDGYCGIKCEPTWIERPACKDYIELKIDFSKKS